MAGMFDLPTSSNMVGNFLTTPSTSGFNLPSTNWTSQDLFTAGSPLGTSYTPSMFGSAYSDFNFGPAASYGSSSKEEEP